VLRDYGTREFCEKRQYLINGADPQLAATASGTLLANGLLCQNQHDAALHFACCYVPVFGYPWRSMKCRLAEVTGNVPSRRADLHRP
jgi:hypothetical protein